VFGSGVILRMTGGDALLATNRHVVAEGRQDADPKKLEGVQVQLLGQALSPAKVLWLAPHGVDLALVRVPCHSNKARAALWQRGRALQIGQTVFAIGNPHGLGWTQTQGVVSQLRRQTTNGFETRLIQTQAALNPGNSGGGLFDQEGYLIGINTWIHDHRVSEGLGFAIALDTLLALRPEALEGAAEGKDKP
jgi:S1-C subfamily serine protease